MKKNYIAPQTEDVTLDSLMQSYLDVATTSNPQQQTAD